jgi:hypothetical protein
VLGLPDAHRGRADDSPGTLVAMAKWVMATTTLIRRSLIGLLASAAGLLLLAWAARADEVSGQGRADGLVVHDAAQTLRDYCRLEDGVLWLVLPTGARYELVTDVHDPMIANSGDGAFHAFDAGEVRSALAALSYPLAGLSADIFILPYPRRAGLESAAGPGLILLSPGVRALSPEHQHAELAHEIGHVVHQARMPDGDLELWSRYRALRGIEDAATFSAASAHAFRPHEIFAEDFRALFGDALANYNGGVENPSIVHPTQVPGLSAFLLELTGAAAAPALRAFPNPTRGPVSFTVAPATEADAPIDLYDLAGRRVATVHPTRAAGRSSWWWDGRDAQGRAVAPGPLFARARHAAGPALRLTVTR